MFLAEGAEWTAMRKRSRSRRSSNVVAWTILCCFLASDSIAAPLVNTAPGERATFSAIAAQAIASLEGVYYDGAGHWRDCPEPACSVHNGDWGSDSLTYVSYLRWKASGVNATPQLFENLVSSAAMFGKPCRTDEPCSLWSDVPMWDSIAASREHEVIAGDVIAAQKARAAFWAIEGSPDYDRGACPSIRYQQPFGQGDRLKTLETDSNGIKAALLLFEATHEANYLAIAKRRYDAVRRYFLDATLPLYSVYVFDDGARCVQVPHRFFASVNGNMISNGLLLARFTAKAAYRAQAVETAEAVDRYLSDPRGIFADLQAENDIVEPLVEAMLDLATAEHQSFARSWILRNATAAFGARREDGAYGRFFDAPPPAATVTAWQTNGGFAVEVAAAALAPMRTVIRDDRSATTFVNHEVTAVPATIRFDGSAITVTGTLGERCCQAGHVRVLVDGTETESHVGIWQNKSSSGRTIADSTLFAWRWPQRGVHAVTFERDQPNAKEGGVFLHVTGYALLDPH